MTRYKTYGTLPAVVLGLLLRELVEAKRIGQDGADTIAMLAVPEGCWGIHGVDLQSAVRQAVSPRTWQKRIDERLSRVGAK